MAKRLPRSATGVPLALVIVGCTIDREVRNEEALAAVAGGSWRACRPSDRPSRQWRWSTDGSGELLSAAPALPVIASNTAWEPELEPRSIVVKQTENNLASPVGPALRSL